MLGRLLYTFLFAMAHVCVVIYQTFVLSIPTQPLSTLTKLLLWWPISTSSCQPRSAFFSANPEASAKVLEATLISTGNLGATKDVYM